MTFQEAWAKKEAEGYQYGSDALEQVRFGWELREAEVTALRDELKSEKANREEAVRRKRNAGSRIKIIAALAKRAGFELCRNAALALAKEGERDDIEGGICSWIAGRLRGLQAPPLEGAFLNAEPYELGGEGDLVVSQWLAEQKGWV